MFARAITAINGVIFGLTGLAFLVDPVQMAAAIDLILDSPVSRNEVRTFYGGLEVGMGTFLLYTAVRAVWITPALVVQIAITAGLLIGRLLGFAIDGLPGGPVYVLLAIEAGMGLASVFAYTRAATRAPT